MTDERLAEIEKRLSNSTSEPILEREDYDYYQGGTYLGTKPYYYVDGKRIEGFEQNGKDGDLYFHNDIFKVEGSEGDKLLFINAHKDITDLIAALRAERAKVAELESTNQWMHGLIKTYQAEKAELQKELETYRWIEKHRKENEHCSYCCGTGLKQIEVIDEPGQPPTDG